MNINDVNVEELWPTAVELYGTENQLEIIFARQKELMEKYLVLEAVLMDEKQITIPVDVHSAKGQQVLKARAWWITEELVEALDALEETDSTKFLEEISDALHFMTELWILAGLDSSTINKDVKQRITSSLIGIAGKDESLDIRLFVLKIIVSLGRAAWQLRNKPWKKTQVLTDLPQFTQHMKEAYFWILLLLRCYFGLNMQQICLLYLRKSVVNKFRQRSNY